MTLPYELEPPTFVRGLVDLPANNFQIRGNVRIYIGTSLTRSLQDGLTNALSGILNSA